MAQEAQANSVLQKKDTTHATILDNIFGIALIGGEDRLSTNKWKTFQADINNFGILRWEVDKPSSRVDFLGLTINIKDGTVVSKT